MTSPSVRLEDRLWSRVEVDNESGCWLWHGALAAVDPVTGDGYGHLVYRGTHYGTHRLSWELTFGPIPDGRQVAHRCDRRRCVRPDHLFLATAAENMADASTKGRVHPGEDNGQAKLTEDVVRAIREAYTGARGDQVMLARRYGVSEAAIRFVVRHETWRHVA